MHLESWHKMPQVFGFVLLLIGNLYKMLVFPQAPQTFDILSGASGVDVGPYFFTPAWRNMGTLEETWKKHAVFIPESSHLDAFGASVDDNSRTKDIYSWHPWDAIKGMPFETHSASLVAQPSMMIIWTVGQHSQKKKKKQQMQATAFGSSPTTNHRKHHQQSTIFGDWWWLK